MEGDTGVEAGKVMSWEFMPLRWQRMKSYTYLF